MAHLALPESSPRLWWRIVGLCTVAVALLVDGTGAQRIDTSALPNFDVRTERSTASVGYVERAASVAASGRAFRTAARAEGIAALQADVTGLEVVASQTLGTLEVVSARPGTGFLTGPSPDRVGAMRTFLSRYSDAYGVSAAEADGLSLLSNYVNPSGNMAWVEFEQTINGLPVFQGLVRGGFTAQGELARTTGTLASVFDPGSLATSSAFTAAQAVAYAAGNVGWTQNAAVLRESPGRGGSTVVSRGTMAADARAWLVYFPVAHGAARLAWATELWGDPDAFLILVDAEDGTVLFRKNATNYQTQSASYNVYTSDSPAPMSPVIMLPGSGTQASYIARVTQALIGNEGPLSFNNLGWMTDGVNGGNGWTDGNNVQAGWDLGSPDGIEAVIGGAARVFNVSYDPQVDAPSTANYRAGEVIDQFYWSNVYHDRLYLLGFTESAGNFQNNNFGRGGVAADQVRAEAQDYSGTNNANFTTMPDGTRGRMQMYVWTGPAPDRSSGIDHDVLIHELTHGTSNRLHGNASGLLATMSGGMGEGWSDFYARSLLSDASEDVNAIYSMGGWVTNLGTVGYTDNYYYGIRRFPHAVKTNLGSNGKPHNPLTFADIDPAQINLTDGAYPPGPFGSASAFQVHNIGEIWAAALFEVRARFINRLGWATGNERILQFVTDGMKLDPWNPTLLQGRDSILAAANAGGGTAADIADIWAGFATRGMGASATIVNPNTGSVVEAFDVPGLVAGSSSLTAESIPNSRIDPAEVVSVSLCIVNNGASTSGSVTGTLAASGGVSSPSGAQSFGTIGAGASVCRTYSFTVSASCSATLTATLGITESGGPSKNLAYAFQVGSPVVIMSQNFDGVVAPAIPAGWTTTAISGTANPWVTQATKADTAPNRAYALSLGTASQSALVSPVIAMPAGAATLTFRHSYEFEPGWDGAVLEIAIPGVMGGAFQDIVTAGGSFVIGGYNATSTNGGAFTPTRSVWTGISAGYISTVVNLPPASQSQNVQLRWRIGSDAVYGTFGWSVDTVVVRLTALDCGAPAVPGAFSHTAPANAAVNQSTSPTLSWGASAGAVSYEYCIDTSNNNVCNATWTSTAAATSVGLSGLAAGTPYYWHVRANNGSGTTYAEGNAATFWSFTTLAVPGAFSHTSPANAATGQSTSPTLSWGASAGAVSYEYCIDTSNNSVCNATWTTTAAATSVGLSGLAAGTPYYWHVRANNGSGTTYAEGNAATFWSFTTLAVPGAFSHTSPANAATGQSTSPTLSWGASAGAVSYEYCIDTSNNSVCNATWTTTAAATSVGLSGLVAGTPYYWHVRANNGSGTTYAEGNAATFWSFTTLAVPGAFSHTSPANAATGQSTSPTLSWGASAGAVSYEYCIDTSNNSVCNATWTTTAAATSVGLSGLVAGTPYYWHVRANNGSGTTYAEGNAATFWSFTTLAVPGAFSHTSPANGATGQSTSPTLSWGASAGAVSYEYCIDTSNNSACNATWTSTAAATSVGLSGLVVGTPYYWHVRANNGSGTTYAEANAATFWSFTTQVAVPGAFSHTAPANSATNQSTSPTLSWGASAGAATYEYCIDTNNNSACDASWTSTGATASIALSGLAAGTTHYWHVRAINPGGTTYAEGNAATFWSFTTLAVPGAFSHTSPANAATGQSTGPTLSWGASAGAVSYEYCIDTSNNSACNATWTSTAAATSVGLSGLVAGTPYYWHVRANNGSGTTYAEGNAATFWSFTTQVAVPGAFSHTSPANAATNQSTSPTLSWGTSAGAATYEYCIDTNNNSACDASWTSTGATASVALSGLAAGTTHYWHVRAINPGGTTYAEANAATFWSFTTLAVPGAFSHTSPANAATGQSTSPTLSWGASAGAVSYEYCIDTSNNSACNATWTSTAAATSVGLSGLVAGTPYYWHVRANNGSGTTYAEGNAATFWSFTTQVAVPGAFSHTSPANAATNQSTSPTLSWGTSAGAATYEYCIDTNNNSACDASWTSTGATASVALSGLAAGTTHYWHVRAINPGGTTYAEANAATFWSFTTLAVPGAFSHTSPANAATGQSTSPTLSWGASAGAVSYEYCIDTSNNSACNATWTSTAAATSVGLSGLVAGTPYYWHVRAINGSGTTYAEANAATFWSFTTQVAVPGAFSHTAPANAASNQSTSPTLSWGSSSGTATYEYCIDTNNNSACDASWTSTGATASVALSGLAAGTTHYWHVRATNPGGTTYAEGNAATFWSFTTLAVPGAFSHTSPANAATGQSTSPTLSWGASAGAVSYEYCIDTSNNSACNATWTSTAAATSVGLSGLVAGTPYYWHVRANNGSGTTYAEGNAATFWSFTTQVAVPGAFSHTSPANAATNQSTSPTLNWGTSAGAATYEYCIDTNNNSACDASWISTGATASVALSGLAAGTTHYWHVRATNPGGTTYAEGNAATFWSFTTLAVPGAFSHTSPANAATGQSTSPTLSWGASAGAVSYEYCIDTSNNSACNATWTSTAAATSVGLSGLVAGTPYYWHVRANNGSGATYAEANAATFWSFTTQVAVPGAFSHTAPANAASNQGTSPTLSWGTSAGAATYEYCIDTNNNSACDASWISTGATASVALSGLAAGTTHYWHVRATNPGGTTYAEGNAATFWSFTTLAVPGAFSHTSPANAATGQSTSPTLSWGASAGAVSYEYCIDTSNNSACNATWTSTAPATSVGLSGLVAGTPYYWHVRAINGSGTTYAEGNAATFWSFTTQVAVPGAFSHTAPANAASNQGTSPTLSWGTSAGAATYEYCIDTNNNSTCDASWTSTGATASVALSGLAAGTTHYWQVRAINPGGTTYAEANAATFWSFTTLAVPGAFSHLSPANAATGQSTSPTLSWGASAGAVSYEYCIDTSNNSACNATWTSTAAATSVGLSGLVAGTPHYWHVRAINGSGTTYAEGNAATFWSFTTSALVPGAFGKATPASGATSQPVNPVLSWGASSGTASYEYCYDTTNNNACDASWVSVGTATSASVTGLLSNTTHYWHVRAINGSGTTYSEADATMFWAFTTGVPAPAFGQVDTPAQNATGVQGAIGVTGWALDDGGVSSVQIYRNCLGFEPGNCQNVLGNSVVYIGDAAFLAGARPDVAAAFPTHPQNARAGWGYLMLTPMLPHVPNAQSFGGQGPLTLYIIATDSSANKTLLGRTFVPGPDFSTPTTFTMANDTIAKPFGAIDTPGQGQTIGGIFNNFGWVITPDLNTVADGTDILVPTNGSTMTVFIDGLPVSTVAYNQCRGSAGNPVPPGVYCNDDVSNIFGNPTPILTPNAPRTSNPTKFRNLDAARAPIGAFTFNTNTLANGLHTIAWSVTDSAGRNEGIGSRFFNVLNGAPVAGASGIEDALLAAPSRVLGAAATLEVHTPGTDGMWSRSGFNLTTPWATMHAKDDGTFAVRLPELGRLELWLGANVEAGYLMAEGKLHPLPVGSSLVGAQFGWTPPAGYTGAYTLVFIRGGERITVTVTVGGR